MGKHWRKYNVGKYRLGRLHDKAVVCWTDEAATPRRRILGVIASEVEARAALDRWVRAATLLKSRDTKTVADIWDDYRADRQKDGKQVANFDWDWKALEPRFGSLEVDAITADVCRSYARDRMAMGKSAGTVWTELTRLRSCINWAAKRRVIALAPYVWVPAKPPPKQRVMSEWEVIALLDACKVPHIRLFVILAISTGARTGAILQLTWDRVDFAAGTIDLRSTEAVNPLTKEARKGRAVVPMTAEARAALTEALTGALSGHVIEWDGEPVSKVRKGFQAAVDAAKLQGVTPHTLRHTAATWLEEDGVDMRRISRVLGHRDQRTTERIYAKPGAETLRPAADVIDMRLQRGKLAKK